ncbi:uncharacterized protein [Asterias amurensis]|uniref:uncharacterized protein n=1 Tax=Asterias amurensis TaxID=7602 RepID=UPI003AB62F5E
MDKVTVKWLEGWIDYEEEVSRTRIKTPNPLKIGMEVQVVCTLKQQYNIYSAKILKITRHGRSDSDESTSHCPTTAHCPTKGATTTNTSTTSRNGHSNSIPNKKVSIKRRFGDGSLPSHGASSKKVKHQSSYDQVNAVPDQDLVIDEGMPSSSETSQLHPKHHNNSSTASNHSNQPSMTTQMTKILTELRQLSKQVSDLQATVSAHSCSCLGRRDVRSTKPDRIPKCVTMGDGQVQIGSKETALLTLDENDYFTVWYQVNNPKDFIVKLLPKVFSTEQLKRSNFNGGQVYNGTDHIMKDKLKDKEPFIALMAEAEKEFPNSMTSPDFERQLRYAVNNKCRR